MELFQVTIKNLTTGKDAFFFINGIDALLEAEYFNKKMVDREGGGFSIKDAILRQLSDVPKVAVSDTTGDEERTKS